VSGGVQHAEAAMCYLSMCATMAHMLSVRDPSKERVFPAAVFKKVMNSPMRAIARRHPPAPVSTAEYPFVP
jgi:hypothetical protein